MFRKLRTWRALPPAERDVLGRALWLLPAVRASLWLLGLRRTRAWLGRSPGRAAPEAGTADERAAAITRLAGIAARYQRGYDTCLVRSLVVWALLQREGLAAEVRVGARRRGGRLEAHAWVERGGQALTDPGDGGGGFTAFEHPLAGPTP